MKINKIINGDCLEELKKLDDNSIDSIVTDPPYGISFMNKKWDYNIPVVAVWRECLRVLKHGGHALVACGTRTQHRMAVNIEDAGFEIRDLIAWVYGSGFPKSHNISKAVDRMRDKNFDGVRAFLKIQIDKSGFTHNQLLDTLGLKQGSGLVTHWTTDNEDSYQILPSVKQWNNLKRVLGFSNEFDGDITEHERKIIGTKKSLALPISQELKGWGEKTEYNITIPATEEAKQWEGWGTALKPAMELWTLCRKPLEEKTVAENVLKYGTGGINIDASRVGTEERTFNSKGIRSGTGNYVGDKDFDGQGDVTVSGRFPANLILSADEDGQVSEEVRECFPETGKSTGGRANQTTSDKYGTYANNFEKRDPGFGDSGNASRFFKSIIYQSKASKRERNAGCEDLYILKDGISEDVKKEIETLLDIAK